MKKSDFLPPIAFRALLRHWPRHGMFGDYPTWEAACAAAPSYSTNVRDAIERAKKARDGTSRPITLMPVLAALAVAGTAPRVLDFGGGLGATYLRVQALVPGIASWCIVELPELVETGTKLFADACLRFANTIDDAASFEAPTMIVFGSVLQYLKDPYNLLSSALSFDPRIVVLDRLPLGERERFMIQRVPPEFGNLRYPVRMLDRRRFEAAMADYDLIVEQDLGRIDPTLVDVAYVSRVYAKEPA